jgi:ABC-type branched-subunit amino acid transport system substrate-binding protein
LLSLVIFAAGMVAGPATATDGGIKDTEILIGQCAALAGPAEGLGTGMHNGLNAAFEEVNAKGGVHGRRIRLLADDDRYEPDKNLDCTAKCLSLTFSPKSTSLSKGERRCS